MKDKDGLYKAAIDDLTIALNGIQDLPLPNPATDGNGAGMEDLPPPLPPPPPPPPLPTEAECLCRRAYAYWLASRFDEAIADCGNVLDPNDHDDSPPEWQTFAHELLGAIYEQLGETRQAVHEYQAAITLNRNSFSLLEHWRLAREKLNRS
jgi:tetratricopeptide (TPR) repeat protein